METILESLINSGEITAGQTLVALREYGDTDVTKYVGESGISIASIAEATLNHIVETGVVTQGKLLSSLHLSGKIDVIKLLRETSHSLVDCIWDTSTSDVDAENKIMQLNNYFDMRGGFADNTVVYADTNVRENPTSIL